MVLNMYKELTNEIWLHTNFYETAEISFEYWNKEMQIHHPDLISTMEKCQRFSLMMQQEQDIIDALTAKKDKIDDAINNIKSINVKVMALRDMGLTQEQVGELIDRSDRQVRRIERKERI